MKRESIKDVPLRRMPALVKGMGLKSYATGQIVTWLYKKRVSKFDEMTNLSAAARDALKEKFSIDFLKLDKRLIAKDETTKYVFLLNDGLKIESVLIPAGEDRLTLCVSTQAGCDMGCLFCRTARMGCKRDLSLGEITGQLHYVSGEAEKQGRHITNIVFMGMGEPLVNFAAVSDAIEIILDERAFNFSKRRVTVSTSGLIEQAKSLTKKYDVKIAISLNATDDKTRNRLMPVNKKFPLKDVVAFCKSYCRSSRHRVTFEYVLIKGINDTKEDMQRLVKLLSGIRSKVNLIPFNPFPGCGFKGPLDATVDEWFKFLTGRGIQTNIRISRGQEILAACGQLAV